MTHLISNLMRSSSTESKKCNKMSHGLHKQLKDCVGRFFRILYRLVSFSLVFVEVILMILKKSYVTNLQPGYIFKKLYQKSKIPLKLCLIPKFQAIRMTIRAWKHRWVFAIYFWSHGRNTDICKIVLWTRRRTRSLFLSTIYCR